MANPKPALRVWPTTRPSLQMASRPKTGTFLEEATERAGTPGPSAPPKETPAPWPGRGEREAARARRRLSSLSPVPGGRGQDGSGGPRHVTRVTAWAPRVPWTTAAVGTVLSRGNRLRRPPPGPGPRAQRQEVPATPRPHPNAWDRRLQRPGLCVPGRSRAALGGDGQSRRVCLTGARRSHGTVTRRSWLTLYLPVRPCHA